MTETETELESKYSDFKDSVLLKTINSNGCVGAMWVYMVMFEGYNFTSLQSLWQQAPTQAPVGICFLHNPQVVLHPPSCPLRLLTSFLKYLFIYWVEHREIQKGTGDRKEGSVGGRERWRRERLGRGRGTESDLWHCFTTPEGSPADGVQGLEPMSFLVHCRWPCPFPTHSPL